MTFKATGRNQRILDKIVEEVGAGSRSELVAAALEAHLLRRGVNLSQTRWARPPQVSKPAGAGHANAFIKLHRWP